MTLSTAERENIVENTLNVYRTVLGDQFNARTVIRDAQIGLQIVGSFVDDPERCHKPAGLDSMWQITARAGEYVLVESTPFARSNRGILYDDGQRKLRVLVYPQPSSPSEIKDKKHEAP